MKLSAPLKALALVVFLAAIAGATYGVQVLLGDGVAGQALTVQSAHPALNATAGHDVTYPLVVRNRGDEARDVSVAVTGPGIEARSQPQRVEADGSATVLLTFRVPADAAPGEVPLDLAVLDAQGATLREREGGATLRVLAPAEAGFGPGDVAQVVYTGRLADNGRVFNTNDPALRDLDFPKTETYQFSAGLLEVRTLPNPSVVPGFYEGMLGMQPGESRTVTFPPEKGYGNGTVEETIDRTTTVERRETLDLPEAPLPTQSFAQFLQETGQGKPGDYEVGDFVRHTRNGEDLRYRVVNKTDAGVTLRLHVEPGERYTLYPYWPNASVVQEVSETTATFLTTPAVAEGEAFTYYDHWPELSTIASMNETAIVIRHDPPVGHQYTQSAGQFQPPTPYTVVSVDEERIVVSTPSTNPLAGEALTFDIRMTDLRRQGAS